MTRFQHVLRAFLLACAVGVMWPPGTAQAQSPVFNFDGPNSPAFLLADVYADDPANPGVVTDTQTSAGFYSPFPFSGGTVDWGNTLNLVAQDGGVSSSANPLVRLDGDGTQRVSIAWKGFNILSASNATEYYGDAYSDVLATLYLTLDNLVPFQTYTIFYQWTAEGFADGQHEASLEDPEYASGSLAFDVGGFGPGLVFARAVNNVGSRPLSVFLANAGAFNVMITSGTSLDVSVDLYAMADSQFVFPNFDDLVLTIFRGTLNLTVFGGPLPGVIITEVVDGDLPGGTPKWVEITNCGYLDWAFGPDDRLNIYFNGSTTAGTSVNLDGIALAVGDSYVIASSLNSGITQYQAAYGTDADQYVNVSFGNGNDVYSLEAGANVLDTYGIIGVDGAAEAWCYEDSYAYSKPCRAPNGGIFDADNWRFGGPGALDAPTDPDRIALLQALTTPGVHSCIGAARITGDFDGDGDVDVDDYFVFSDCMGGPGTVPSPTPPTTALECLDAFDFEPDSDVDLGDFAGFQHAYTGP